MLVPRSDFILCHLTEGQVEGPQRVGVGVGVGVAWRVVAKSWGGKELKYTHYKGFLALDTWSTYMLNRQIYLHNITYKAALHSASSLLDALSGGPEIIRQKSTKRQDPWVHEVCLSRSISVCLFLHFFVSHIINTESALSWLLIWDCGLCVQPVSWIDTDKTFITPNWSNSEKVFHWFQMCRLWTNNRFLLPPAVQRQCRWGEAAIENVALADGSSGWVDFNLSENFIPRKSEGRSSSISAITEGQLQ